MFWGAFFGALIGTVLGMVAIFAIAAIIINKGDSDDDRKSLPRV